MAPSDDQSRSFAIASCSPRPTLQAAPSLLRQGHAPAPARGECAAARGRCVVNRLNEHALQLRPHPWGPSPCEVGGRRADSWMSTGPGWWGPSGRPNDAGATSTKGDRSFWMSPHVNQLRSEGPLQGKVL